MVVRLAVAEEKWRRWQTYGSEAQFSSRETPSVPIQHI